MPEERNYRKEYDEFHGKPTQIRRRAARNKARRIRGLEKGDKREVDHKVALSRGGGNGGGNLRITTRKRNRRKADK